MTRRPQLIDFFSGAGGFSEGFRQQGFQVVMGIDNWSPAIETFNLNHHLKDQPKDVLDFHDSLDEITKLPDTEVIVGSPPCVLFSLSNKGGKADKTLGIHLIESFLRVVAVKKHQPSSRLVAWFMENVPNSKNFIQSTYTFRDLNLETWATDHKINPDTIALNASLNGNKFDTADFGTSQKRARFLCGEIVSTGNFPDLRSFMNGKHRSIGAIKGKMPSPTSRRSTQLYTDPNYPSLQFRAYRITDHFYDSGLYEIQWRSARAAKINHPYMGKMSFPEDENNPSRTIMATRSLTVRESIIYKSEYNRRGDGEYRLPTIREIATLMGFPYSYQFSGSEDVKWRQIGNAVCPPMSSALAKSVRLSMRLPIIPDSEITSNALDTETVNVNNLNTFSERPFDKPPKRKPNARFRKHPFKEGNMTVALTNFNPAAATFASARPARWHSSVFIGCGKDFILKRIRRNGFKRIGRLIERHHQTQGRAFISEFDKRFKNVIGNSHRFQRAYVADDADNRYEPGRLIDKIGDFILDHEPAEKYMKVPDLIPEKEQIPTKQVLAMYAINRIVS